MAAVHGGDIYRNQVQIDFSVNGNPLGMPEKVREKLHEAVAHCTEYPDPEYAALKQAVGARLEIPEKYLLFGNGASELFMAIVHAIEPKKILIPVPSFYGYEYAAQAVESEIVFYPCKEEVDFALGEAFPDSLTDDIDLLFLANPNNPTGQRIDGAYLRRILEICQQKSIWVVLDECFIEFCGNRFSMIKELDMYDRLIVVRAFTKIYAIPGVRLGYLASCNLPLLARIKRQLPEWNLSTFAQQAGIACTGQKEYVNESVVYVRTERKFLSDGLRELGLKAFTGEADFILLYSELPLYEALLQKGLLIRDCSNFRGLGTGYYRIAVRTRNENERLLSEIGEWIERNRTVTTGRN